MQQFATGIILDGMNKHLTSLIAIAGLSICSARAQGLQGAPVSQGTQNQPPLVAGKSTVDRWATIGKIAPELIGKTRAEVEKKLGKGMFNTEIKVLAYRISENPTAKTSRYDNLTIWFDKSNRVYKFEAEDKPFN